MPIRQNHQHVIYEEPPPPAAPPTLAAGQQQEKSKCLHLMARDLAILETLYHTPYMTAPQIQALFWRLSQGGTWGRQKACERRLRQLAHHHLVRRIEQRVKWGQGHKPYLYALGEQGMELLVAELGLSPVDCKPKAADENYPFLQHLLATTDFRIALQLACENQNMTLEVWISEKVLKSQARTDKVWLYQPSGQRQKVAVVPDGGFILGCDNRKAMFFVEIDRKTVTVAPAAPEQRGWSRKVAAYLAYLTSEVYQQRYAGRPVRILTVTAGQKRLMHLKQTTEAVLEEYRKTTGFNGGAQWFWFTTFEHALHDNQVLTMPIWSKAGSQELFALAHVFNA